MLSGIKKCKVKFKSPDEIFKIALLVPSQEVTGYNPEIILLRILSWVIAKQWKPLWTGSKVQGVNHQP